MDYIKETLGVINLDDLNACNKERVEDMELHPLSISDAYEAVESLIDSYAEDLAESAKEKALNHIERFISYNWNCYEGNNLEYADNSALVNAIAEKARQNLF